MAFCPYVWLRRRRSKRNAERSLRRLNNALSLSEKEEAAEKLLDLIYGPVREHPTEAV